MNSNTVSVLRMGLFPYIYTVHFFPWLLLRFVPQYAMLLLLFDCSLLFFHGFQDFSLYHFFFFFGSFAMMCFGFHISFLLLWSQMMINLVAYNNTNLLSYSSRCQKFKNGSYGAKIKVVAGRPSSRGSK